MKMWQDREIAPALLYFMFKEPEMFNEWALQKAIEEVWDYLFTKVMMLCRTSVADNWWPDIFACNLENGCYLIVELKAVHKCSQKRASMAQIVRYANEFLSKRPGRKLKLLILGKWDVEQVDFSGFCIQFFPYKEIGKYLKLEFPELFFGPFYMKSDKRNGTLLEDVLFPIGEGKSGTEVELAELGN